MAKKEIPIIKPRAKQILIEPDPEESRESKHGLITPSNVDQDQKAIGTVIAVGGGITDIKKGDRVIYGTFAGDDLEFKDSTKEVKYKILHDDDVLALIED